MPVSQHSGSSESFLELSEPFLPAIVFIDWWLPNKESAHFSSITVMSLLDKFLHPHLISILQPYARSRVAEALELRQVITI